MKVGLVLGTGEDNGILIIKYSTCPVCCKVHVTTDFMIAMVNVYRDVQVSCPEEVLSMCLRVINLFDRLGKDLLKH